MPGSTRIILPDANSTYNKVDKPDGLSPCSAIRVVICDDNRNVVATLEQYCHRYSHEHKVPLTTTSFSDGDELVSKYEGADILLIDVEMPLLNGLEASAAIRRRDSRVRIVFVTSFLQYAVNGYRVGAYRYLVKPVDYRAFSEAFGGIAEQVALENESFLALPTADGFFRIRIADIVVVETGKAHRLRVSSTSGNEYQVAQTLSSMRQKLAGSGFCQISRGVLANFAHVQALSGSAITMDNGRVVYISKRRHTDVITAFSKYLEHTTMGDFSPRR